MSANYFRDRSGTAFLLFLAAVVSLLLFLCAQVSGQTEEEMLTDARVKMKLKDYGTAEAILKEANQKYPSSVEIAETLVRLYEETKNTEELIDACTRLIGILQLKEVKEKNLSSKESSLLKETEKKLAELVKIRTEADTAIEQFVKEGIEICRKLVSLKRYSEACYILQRLSALKVKEEEVKNLAQEMGKENSELIRRPDTTKGADTEKAEKLLLEAQKSFKGGKLDEASVTCKAALEVDPGQAAAVALLSDIAEKMGKTEESLIYGLTYLLFPPDAQSAARAEEIEKSISKASAELKPFFDATRKCADDVCKTAENAIREKRKTDLEYVLERLALLTHRTKRVESILSKAQIMLEAQAQTKDPIILGKLLDSDDFSIPNEAWGKDSNTSFHENGRYVIKNLNPTTRHTNIRDRQFLEENLYFEVEIELIGEATKENTFGGFCFREQGQNQPRYIFVISPDGRFEACFEDGKGGGRDLTGKGIDLVSTVRWTPCKYIKRNNAKNVLAVACCSNCMFFYINKHLIFACEEKSISRGRMALTVGTGTYAFDNLKVYEASLRKK